MNQLLPGTCGKALIITRRKNPATTFNILNKLSIFIEYRRNRTVYRAAGVKPVF
jgi:hypothetical protein